MQVSRKALAAYQQQRSKGVGSTPCLAPWKSLYFGFRGKVSVCCFNKTHVVGQYPEQSIREIWKGEKVKQIREALEKADFSLGCNGCQTLIEAGNYGGLPAKNFDYLPDKDYPSKIDFELSNECNLECIMCRGEFSSAIRKNREKLPPIQTVYDATFIEQLEEFIPHLSHSHFLGGEPFLIPIYLEIWERMIQLNPGIRISIQTNGTILTERIKGILAKASFEIAVSIDSIDKENYEQIRKNGNFDKVMENIRFFRDYCSARNTAFHLSYCPMVQNWHELPEVVALANKLDCPVFFNTVFYPRECSLAAMDLQEITNVITTLEQHSCSELTEQEKQNAKAYQEVLQQLRYWRKEVEAEGGRKSSKVLEGNTIQSYFDGFRNYLKTIEELQEEERELLYEDVTLKLNFILETARESGRELEAEKYLTQVDYKSVYQSVPSSDKEHLLYLFKSYVMPLPDTN
jgi:MoaA/NifB/PqqE/SkfB family radical SAM enzyme